MNRAAQRAISLARHGEPALSRKVRLSARGYRDWWAQYEEGGIRKDQTPPAALLDRAARAGALLSSTRLRARETAAAVSGGRTVVSDTLFIEAPLPPPPLPDAIKLSPRLWGVVARTAWWFGYSEGGETRAQAKVRAAQAAERLIAETESHAEVLLLAHGYFNHMIGVALKARGWRMAENQGYRYWAVRSFVAPLSSQ